MCLRTLSPTLQLCSKKVMVSVGGCGCGTARSHPAYARVAYAMLDRNGRQRLESARNNWPRDPNYGVVDV